MSTPARQCMGRAAQWAAGDRLVRAAIVFGSVAAGLDDEYSDLDLILVAQDDAGEDLWRRRTEIAQLILGGEVVAAQEPSWQGPRRYQAWTAQARQLDLTVVEGVPAVFGGLAKDFVTVYDRDTIGQQLTMACASWTAPHHDAVPRSAEPAELARALHATASTYDWALDRWAARTGRQRPHHALAGLTLSRWPLLCLVSRQAGVYGSPKLARTALNQPIVDFMG